MEPDIRIPGAAFLPPFDPSDAHLHWLQFTRTLIGFSSTKKRTRTTAAIATLGGGNSLIAVTDGFPKGVIASNARQQDPDCWDGMHLSAAEILVSQAAAQGRSLSSQTVYYWPMISSAKEAALLISAGIREIIEPDYPIPVAKEASRRIIAMMASEAGVTMARIPMDAIFVSHSNSYGEQP